MNEGFEDGDDDGSYEYALSSNILATTKNKRKDVVRDNADQAGRLEWAHPCSDIINAYKEKIH